MNTMNDRQDLTERMVNHILCQKEDANEPIQYDKILLIEGDIDNLPEGIKSRWTTLEEVGLVIDDKLHNPLKQDGSCSKEELVRDFTLKQDGQFFVFVLLYDGSKTHTRMSKFESE